MTKHAVVFSREQIQELLEGELKYDLRFFKKRPEFLNKLNIGDIIFFRKSRGEVIGQFEVGKLIIVENLDAEDQNVLKSLGILENFENQLKENSIMVVIQIEKLEQLITSPVEIDKRSRKEWVLVK